MSSRSPVVRFLKVAALAGATACDPSGAKVVGIEATGIVAGVAFLDVDGDRALSPGVDAPLAGARVTLLVRGSRSVAAQATTEASGAYVILRVPVGSYQVALDTATLGDSLRVLRVEPAELHVGADDTATVTIAVGRRAVAIAEARSSPAGRRVTVEGVALHASGVLGDTLLHLSDSTGTLRAVRVRAAPVSEGDSLRLVGVLGVREGQPVLLQAEGVVLGPGEVGEPARLSTAEAAAGGGRLDASLGRITDATVIDASVSPTGNVRLRVDDGSGPLEVILDRRAQITSELPALPGARIDAVGVLIPVRSGGWTLHPRSTSDVEVRIPRVTLAELREVPLGRLVSVEAVALNAWATFGDANVHLADETGTALAVGVPASFIFPGDRIRLYGTAGVFNGWPALRARSDVPPSILGRVPVPTPVPVSTADAARAAGGRLDAALVQVGRAVVVDTIPLSGGDFGLILDDGSGPLDVLLESEAGVSSVVHPPGAVLDVTGLLVPVPGGRSWLLRPRSRADLVRR